MKAKQFHLEIINRQWVHVFITALLILTFNSKSSSCQKQPEKQLLSSIDRNFDEAGLQYKLIMRNLPTDKFPKTFYPGTGKYEFSDSGWWCSGFYPGTLLYIFEQTRDSVLYQEAMRMLNLLEKEQFNTTTHDLGFMMYCSFGLANKIHPSDRYREILLNSAKSLSSRFSPVVGCIRSWDSKKSDFLVIIDNMMNLELLFWASRATGDSSYYRTAVTHANTTLKNHFRPDNSSFHVLNYNPLNGEVQQKRTAQGAADGSAWARGQAWGLYGFTVMYRETKELKYLEQAKRIAAFILNHPNLPTDKVPYWDFNAPGIPNALRDASAAAIMASALLELQSFVDPKTAKAYLKVAQKILLSLSSGNYKAKPGTNGGVLLQHSVGSIPGKSEVDVPLTYADYYFVEAMSRYKALKMKK
jgi:unsaturated chondroitin disaccharide hydrolase